jgi:uncharacterized protein YbcC (UPF0753/DUF2309 family)
MNPMNAPENTTPAVRAFETRPYLEAARAACARIAPLWPLQDFVATNPFLGLTSKPFTEVCELMARLGPGGMQMDAGYYQAKLAEGALNDSDLGAALSLAPKLLSAREAAVLRDLTPETLKTRLASGVDASPVLTVAEAVDRRDGSAWSHVILGGIGQFCAAYFDRGQAAWSLPWKELPLYGAWREQAMIDAAPELLGLSGFRKLAASLPVDAVAALERLLPRFGPAEGIEEFLHKQLFELRGWAGYVQYRVREAGGGEVAGGSLLDLLAIRLALDAVVLAKTDAAILQTCRPARPSVPSTAVLDRFLWQLADEHAWQRHLFGRIASSQLASAAPAPARPAVQAVFCIDVRSEVFRRALEAESPAVATFGFAGFFGLPIEVVPLEQEQPVSQCPVLLKPRYRVCETLRRSSPGAERRASRHPARRKRVGFAWNSFKASAISCFSYVETAGIAFGAPLFRDTFAPAKKPKAPPACGFPGLEPEAGGRAGIPLDGRVELARSILRHLGLMRGFARLVLLCGHGGTTTNNPYAASFDCGACGGHSGDVNARVAAAILNDTRVRAALARDGVEIPQDTLFLAGLHDTTNDVVSLADADQAPGSHAADIRTLVGWLEAAGRTARRARAASLGIDEDGIGLDDAIFARGADWSQVRPEWGLAGNAAFIAAPRERTRSVNLKGRVFLHSYDHRLDADNSTLELILCAPVVVANWINLQYYASTVNNPLFGSGNKAIHNVVGTFGICLGNGGDLQTGLPLQSLHDGTRWVHEPLRLHTVIEAPLERIEAVLAKHASVRQLVENGWFLLFATGAEGRTLHRYLPGGRWEPVTTG